MGSKVVNIGSPRGLTNIVSSGLYSGTFHYDDGPLHILHTARTFKGSSGSPLFNDAGEVIGVHSGKYDEEENLGRAIPIEDVIELYQITKSAGSK